MARAEGSSQGVVLAGRSGAFEELVGIVMSEANAEPSRRRASVLDEVCAVLEVFASMGIDPRFAAAESDEMRSVVLAKTASRRVLG